MDDLFSQLIKDILASIYSVIIDVLDWTGASALIVLKKGTTLTGV